MDPKLDRFAELEKLLSALADEELDMAGRSRIGELLDGDPEACEFYLDYISLDAHLEQELGSMEPVKFFEKLPEAQIAEATTIYLATRQPPPPPVWKQPWTMAAAAAVVAGLFLISLMTQPERERVAKEEQANAMDNAVAVLTDSVGASFGASGIQPTRGDLLPKGLLKLDSGIARLQFYSGAEVILEGPVEFELRGENIAACVSGDFRASVPPAAQGFTVLSPQVEMVDLGTEFGASIGSGGATEIHVFEGEVEVYGANTGRDPDSRDLLTAGYGLRIAPDGTRSNMLADNMAFLSEDEVLQRMRLHAAGRHDAWQRFSAQTLDANPDVMLHFPFVSNDLKHNELLDSAELGGRCDGLIIGSKWVSGRWPGKRALEFVRPSDRVKVTIKEKSNSLTLVAWVKVERLEQRFSALLHTDKLSKGGVGWQITRAGSLQFGIRRNDQEIDNYTSPTVFGDRIGKWTQVAVTLDHRARKVSHFLDGKLVGSHPLKSANRPVIGSAQVGNWDAPRKGDSYPVRNIHGRIDEVLIFKRALGSDEIGELYAVGQP